MAKVKSRKGNVVTIDFSGVEAGGTTLPEDKYEVEVVKVAQETSESSGNDYLTWEFSVINNKKKGKLWHNTSLQQQSLWSLRGLLEALGVEIPDEPLDLDLEDLVGRTVGVEVQHETYNKKTKARIVDFFEIDGETSSEEEVEDEEEETPKKKSKKQEPEEDDEEEEKPKKKKSKKETRTYTSDSILEMDEDQLQEVIDEHELGVDLSDFDKLRRKRSAVIDALEENGLVEDEAA